jgi:hypothetical protein
MRLQEKTVRQAGERVVVGEFVEPLLVGQQL